jgi:hypothetical protein
MTIAVSGQGLVDGSTSASIKFDTFTAKAYDAITPSQYATIDLSGLQVSGTKSDNKLLITAPITISDYAGDSFTGTLTATGYDLTSVTGYGYKTVTQIGLDLAVKAANSPIVSLSLTGTQPKEFNPRLAKSSANNPKTVVSFTATLSDNVTVKVSADETTWGKNVVNGRITSNGNWFQLDTTENVDSSGKSSSNNSTVNITSSGVYSAVFTKSNGAITGDILQGTTKIGTIANGILTVNGKELSFK